MRIRLLLGVVLCASTFVSAPASFAVMQGNVQLKLDFTDEKGAKVNASWNDGDFVKCTPEGLGWAGPKGSFRDVEITTTEPIAIGWNWRPTDAVRIQAEVDPPGKFVQSGGTTTYPPGALFARYSPDCKNWSSWMAVPLKAPKDFKDAKQQFESELRIPQTERQKYYRMLEEYQKLDVPWKSDEEAAVKWIVEKDPDYFSKTIPIVGYVHFLYEIHLEGEARIKSLNFDLKFGTGGMATVPRDRDAQKDRTSPWRYKASEVKTEPK